MAIGSLAFLVGSAACRKPAAPQKMVAAMATGVTKSDERRDGRDAVKERMLH
jgi:hypothetical protein